MNIWESPQIKIISIKTCRSLEDKISPSDFLARSKRNVEEMKNELKVKNSKD